MDFLLNDPSTPDLVENIAFPEVPPNPKFVVRGFTGNIGTRGSLENHAAQVYITLANAVNMVHSNLSTFTHWAAVNILTALPHAGNNFNAYYDRNSLKFFSNKSPEGNNMIFACESVDIVSHELGHAILDSQKPELWNTHFLEVYAFHEAFGDIIATLTALQSDKMINRVLSETGNDLGKSNISSRLAEEMGHAVYVASGGKCGYGDCLRNSVNDFQYSQPETLPTSTNSDNNLSQEPHNFSRVFSGAWYDCLVDIFRKSMAKGVDPVKSVKIARDVMLKCTLFAIQYAAVSPRFYNSMAQAFLISDKNFNSGNDSDTFLKCFSARKILTNQMSIIGGIEDNTALDTSRAGKISLAKREELQKITRNNVDIELNVEHYNFFNSQQELIGRHSVITDEIIDSGNAAIDFIEQKNLVGNMFSVEGGKLNRNYYHCC